MKNVVRALLLLALLTALMFAVPSGALVDGALAEGAYPALSLEAEKGGAPLESGYDGLSYHDDTITVTVEETRAYDTTILIARVTISDPSQIRTAMAGATAAIRRRPAPGWPSGCGGIRRQRRLFQFFQQRLRGPSGHALPRQPRPRRDILLIDDQGIFTSLRTPPPKSWPHLKEP